LLRSLRRGNPTDASVLLTALAAIALTALLYFVVGSIRPLRASHIGVLLNERTWVVHFTVFLAIWAGVIMLVKFWKLAGQQAALSYDLLPPDPAVRIHPGNVGLVQEHIRKLPVNPRQCFLVNRVLLALDNFKARHSVPEVGVVLTSQSETDAARVDSSYTMLKVLVWGIPILGFIGTVVGISDAVSGFTHSVQAAENLDVVRGALGKVTEGLAVAFDTTFIGLVLSIVVMFPIHTLQKAEDDLLSAVDQYCNENLLSRLAADSGVASADSPEADGSLRQVMNAHLTALQDCQRRLERFETVLGEKASGAILLQDEPQTAADRGVANGVADR
jgi:hypothetical protein